jgi:hypothetical protein
MMAQDFTQWSLQQLSGYALASCADVEALGQVEDELKYRREPQALTLLVLVRDMLKLSGTTRRSEIPERADPVI